MIRQIQTLYGSFRYNQCSEQYSFPWFVFCDWNINLARISFCSFPYYLSYQLSTVVNQNLLKKPVWCRKWQLKLPLFILHDSFTSFFPMSRKIPNSLHWHYNLDLISEAETELGFLVNEIEWSTLACLFVFIVHFF